MTVEELVAQGFSSEEAGRVVAELSGLPLEQEDMEFRFMREFG